MKSANEIAQESHEITDVWSASVAYAMEPTEANKARLLEALSNWTHRTDNQEEEGAYE